MGDASFIRHFPIISPLSCVEEILLLELLHEEFLVYTFSSRLNVEKNTLAPLGSKFHGYSTRRHQVGFPKTSKMGELFTDLIVGLHGHLEARRSQGACPGPGGWRTTHQGLAQGPWSLHSSPLG